MQLIDSQALTLALIDLSTGRNNNLLHLLTEPCHILWSVVVTAFAQIRHLDIIIHSKLLGHTRTQLYKTGILGIQLGRYLLIHLGPCLKSLFTFRTVHTLHMLQQSVKIAFLSAECRMAHRCCLLILLYKIALFNSVLDDRRIQKLGLLFQIVEQVSTKLPLKFRAER